MNYVKRTKLFAGLVAGVVVISVASVLGFFMMFLNREQLRQMVNKEKLAHERTVSEKLLADKDLGFLQKEFQRLDEANTRLSAYLTRAESEVREKDVTIEGLTRDNRELHAVKSELGSLKVNSKELDQQVKMLSKSIDELIKRNQQMAEYLGSLQEETERLRTEYERTVVHKGIGRAFRVDALRGTRLTTAARRAKKLVVSFEPVDRKEFLKLKTETYYIILSDESGGVYNLLKNQKATVSLQGNPVEIMPSFILEANPTADRINRLALEMSDLKLNGGVYNMEIYTSTAFVGSTQIRLN